MAVRNGETGLAAAAGRVADHARRLVTLELELARNELKRKAGVMAFGAGLGAGAVIFALLAVTLLVAAVAAALALVIPVWAALLAVGFGALLLAAGLGMAAVAALKRGAPPVPEQAIEEARFTSAALRSDAGS
jgi:hypothetical protein